MPKEISGELEKTEWTATAKITFLLDLHNDSDVPSAEIEMAYFYAGREWAFFQDNSSCANTESDLPGFKRRYFLNCPIKRLPRSGWAQLRFRAERVVAIKAEGDELQDSYPISGRSILRLVTDKGHFDYEIPINTTAEVPFPF